MSAAPDLFQQKLRFLRMRIGSLPQDGDVETMWNDKVDAAFAEDLTSEGNNRADVEEYWQHMKWPLPPSLVYLAERHTSVSHNVATSDNALHANFCIVYSQWIAFLFVRDYAKYVELQTSNIDRVQELWQASAVNAFTCDKLENDNNEDVVRKMWDSLGWMSPSDDDMKAVERTSKAVGSSKKDEGGYDDRVRHVEDKSGVVLSGGDTLSGDQCRSGGGGDHSVLHAHSGSPWTNSLLPLHASGGGDLVLNPQGVSLGRHSPLPLHAGGGGDLVLNSHSVSPGRNSLLPLYAGGGRDPLVPDAHSVSPWTNSLLPLYAGGGRDPLVPDAHSVSPWTNSLPPLHAGDGRDPLVPDAHSVSPWTNALPPLHAGGGRDPLVPNPHSVSPGRHLPSDDDTFDDLFGEDLSYLLPSGDAPHGQVDVHLSPVVDQLSHVPHADQGFHSSSTSSSSMPGGAQTAGGASSDLLPNST
jgi:hypothetical protein